jgi:hypothetical protein
LPLPCICNGSSVSETAGNNNGTDFFEIACKQFTNVTTVTQFQRHSGKNAFKAVISFWETRCE